MSTPPPRATTVAGPRTYRTSIHAKYVVICLLLLFILASIDYSPSNQLDLEDAIYLTKNSIKEFTSQHFNNNHNNNHNNNNHNNNNSTDNDGTFKFDIELDYPLNSVMNSFFPIDSLISFNTTLPKGNSGSENITSHEMLGRYASFSPVLDHPIYSNYAIFPNNACKRKNYSNHKDYKNYNNKTLIVLRGDCTFVDKVSNLLESGLNPTSIIIANDEPYRGLITMFSGTFNQDGSLKVPIIFITNEDYKYLKELDSEDILIEISTATIGSWINILVSMILSPPLLILFFYSVVVCGQRFKRRQANIRNAKLVKRLPIYIYNIDHLIHAKYLTNYLKITGQTSDDFKDVEYRLLDSPKQSPMASSTSLHKIIINGIDIRSSSVSLHTLCAPDNFYPAYKCSICLDKYIPLRSRVLLLNCKHFYHEKCLSNWLINFKRSCPLCNTMINNSQNDTYLLAGQEGSSDYGSLNDSDLEGQFVTEGNIPYVTDSVSQIESDEDDVLYHDYLEPASSSLFGTRSITQAPETCESTIDVPPPITPPPHQQQQPSYLSPSSSSHISDPSFVTAQTELESPKVSNNSGLNSPRKYFYSRPSQILSQYSSSSNQNQTRSVSQFSNGIESERSFKELSTSPQYINSSSSSTIDQVSDDDDTNTINND